MTAPNADQQVFAKLGGIDPGTGATLMYQFTPEVMGRCTWDNDDSVGPYRTEFAPGKPVVGSAASYDQIASLKRLQGSRHVDPLGNVATPKKAWLLQWYWFLDGCPTPLTRARLAVYMARAKVLRGWPTGFVGAMPGEPTQDFSKVDPNASLDSLM